MLSSTSVSPPNHDFSFPGPNVHGLAPVASVKGTGHVYCPYYALCHQMGSYVPDSGHECRSSLATVAVTPALVHADTLACMDIPPSGAYAMPFAVPLP